ncbi:DUF4089 domain-containing protein (plasmid) [Acidithiobacillus caldus]|nr:DUF4089 domain-containing protein [Acidithiobacillus caldus]AUW34127.1 DUF4089 domain-containing protein [Acidithiobacillus caldus]
MSDWNVSADAVERYMRETSAMVGLSIAEEYIIGVKNYLQISLRMMAVLEVVPLSIGDDFGPVFRA